MPSEVWDLLTGLQQVEGFIGKICMKYEDECLHSLTTLLRSYTKTETETKFYLQSFNAARIHKNDIEEFIREKMLQSCESELKAKYLSLSEELSNLEAEYDKLLDRFRKIIQAPKITYTSLKFGTGKVVDHLLELDKLQANRVPPDWLLVSSTQRLMRFHPREITALQLREDCIRNTKKKLVHRYWQQFLLELDAQLYVKGMRCVETLAEIDVFCSMATVARFANYVRPSVVCSSMQDTRQILHIYNGRHPVIEQLQEKSSYITNSVELGGDDSSRCLLLSGPNMGGKSTYLRMCALIVIMAQLGSFVPAEGATISVFDRILAVIPFSLNDSNSRGVSSSLSHYELYPSRGIRDEMKILSNVLKESTSDSLVLIDEVGYGIPTRYCNSVAYGCLRYLIEKSTCLTLFASHMSETISLLKEEFCLGEVLTHQLSYHHAAGDKKLIFQYEARNGVAEKSFAMNTASLARLPTHVLNTAKEIVASFKIN
jgi:DNA mismatch repair ATPase MutS